MNDNIMFPHRMSSRPKARFSEPMPPNASRSKDAKTTKTTRPLSRSAPTPRTKTFAKVIKPIKPRQYTHKPDLAQKLADQLDEHREQLFQTTHTKLDATEASHKAAIDALEAQFTKKLTLLVKAETCMSADIGDEVLKIQMPNTKGASGKPKFRNIKLGERAHAYGAFLDGKKKEVDALFEQWDQIQGKIICLATRLLGPEIVDVSDPEEGTQLRQDVSEAVKSYKKTHKNQQNELERMQEIEEAAKELSAETRGTIDGIAQDYNKEKARRAGFAARAKKYQEDFE